MAIRIAQGGRKTRYVRPPGNKNPKNKSENTSRPGYWFEAPPFKQGVKGLTGVRVSSFTKSKTHIRNSSNEQR